MPHFGPGNVGHQPPPGGGSFFNNQNIQPFVSGGVGTGFQNPNFNPVPGPGPGGVQGTGLSFINPNPFSPPTPQTGSPVPTGLAGPAGAAALQSVGGNEGAGGRTVGSQAGILNTLFSQAGAAGGAAGPGVTPGGPVPITPRRPDQLGTGPNASQISSGGQLFGPEDVDFFLANGMITPEQADILRQVASRDLGVSQTLTSRAGFNQGAGAPPVGGSQGAGTQLETIAQQQSGQQTGGQGTQLETIAQQQNGGGVAFQGPSGGVLNDPRTPFQGETFGGGTDPGTGGAGGGGGAQGFAGGPVPPFIDPLFGQVFGSVPGGLPTAAPFVRGSDEAKQDRANRTADLDRLSGAFANDIFGLPGNEAGIPFGLLLNMLFGAQGAQEQRLGQAENILGGAVGNLAQGPAVGIATGVGTELQRNPFTTSSPELQKEVDASTRRNFATAQQGALSGLADRSAASGTRGGESDFLRAATDFGGRAALSDALTQNRLQFSQNRANDIAAALGGAQSVGDTFTSQLLDPAAAQAGFLSGPRAQNPFFDAIIEALNLATGANIQQAIGSATNPLSTPGGVIGSFAQGIGSALPFIL